MLNTPKAVELHVSRVLGINISGLHIQIEA